eukprot:g20490.t1
MLLMLLVGDTRWMTPIPTWRGCTFRCMMMRLASVETLALPNARTIFACSNPSNTFMERFCPTKDEGSIFRRLTTLRLRRCPRLLYPILLGFGFVAFWTEGIKFSDADFLKMLINLVGDLHQPLHVGYANDNSGRKVLVKFRGQTMSLYDVWDHAISEVVRTQESNFWLGGWTHVRAVSWVLNLPYMSKHFSLGKLKLRFRMGHGQEEVERGRTFQEF